MIYLDHNATTQIDPRVIEAMLSEFRAPPSNPSSPHTWGREARARLIKARGKIASFFGVAPEEMIFTSGGTESVNLFLRGLEPKGHIVASPIDHSCVYNTLQELQKKEFSITFIPVDAWGAPQPDAIEAAIREDTKALVFSAANAETGVKLDVEAVAKVAHRRGIPLFLDAVAWIGKERFPMYPGIAAVAFSGHKFHGPKGIGGLVLRSSCKIAPQITGGAQEYRKRAGTENLPAIMGLAEAFAILEVEQDAITTHLRHLQSRFEAALQLPVNGKGPRIANTSNLTFSGIDGETLLIQLDRAGIMASYASACASGALEPSRVLLQMGLSRKEALASVRFSLSRVTTVEEIDRAVAIITMLMR